MKQDLKIGIPLVIIGAVMIVVGSLVWLPLLVVGFIALLVGGLIISPLDLQ